MLLRTPILVYITTAGHMHNSMASVAGSNRSITVAVFASINQKGGTGKSALTTNLAFSLAEATSVPPPDADTQSSAQD